MIKFKTFFSQVDQVLIASDRTYADMSVNVTRPFTSNAVAHVILGRVLKATIAFKGLMMERVVVMGFNEQLDLWTESRYKVFQRVTDHAHAAMLHYNNPNLPETTVKNFLVSWRKKFLLLNVFMKFQLNYGNLTSRISINFGSDFFILIKHTG